MPNASNISEAKQNAQNGLLSKPSTSSFEIENACDEIKPKSEAFSAVTIPVGYDFEAFYGANDVLIKHTI